MEISLINFDEKSQQKNKPAAFLVVDDDVPARQSLVKLLKRKWPDLTEASDGDEAISLSQQRQFKLIILDLNMPRKSGDQVLTFIKQKKIDTTVIVISGENSINKFTEAVRLGAFGFIDKAEPMERVVQEIEQALRQTRLEREVEELQEGLGGRTPLVGSSPAMDELRGLISKIAPVPSPANGLTMCAGSYGARSDNDLVAMIREFHDRIYFVHLRNIKREADGSFYESDHLDGDNDIVGIVNALLDAEQERQGLPPARCRIPMRPDHGHALGEEASDERVRPGYSYAGRMKGLAELRGVIHALAATRQ